MEAGAALFFPNLQAIHMSSFDLGAVSHTDVDHYRRKIHDDKCIACRLGKNKAAPSSKTDHLTIPHEIGTLYANIMTITDGAHLYLVGVDQQTVGHDFCSIDS